MHYKNQTSENIKDTADLFAQYFSTVYAASTDPLNFQCNNDCSTYLNISDNDILIIINGLDKNKVIPAIFYKNTAIHIIKPLSILFNKSITTMQYPD